VMANLDIHTARDVLAWGRSQIGRRGGLVSGDGVGSKIALRKFYSRRSGLPRRSGDARAPFGADRDDVMERRETQS
jgi:hypothetical protein